MQASTFWKNGHHFLISMTLVNTCMDTGDDNGSKGRFSGAQKHECKGACLEIFKGDE
jgi:hypothetical protein